MKLFTYWEGGEVSPYLKACVATWYTTFPDLELTIVNHSNVEYWIADSIQIDQFKKLSFAMQSDVVSAAILSKFGGVFIDIDTLILGKRAKTFLVPLDEKLHCFGRSVQDGFHLALLSSLGPNRLARLWLDQISRLTSPLPKTYSWDFVGNAPLSKILASVKSEDFIEVHNRRTHGVILEDAARVPGSSSAAYVDFWFNNQSYCEYDYRATAAADLIMLHNSWTPSWVKELPDLESIKSKKNLFSRIIDDTLDTEIYKECNIPHILRFKEIL